jgi:hypothetical protein
MKFSLVFTDGWRVYVIWTLHITRMRVLIHSIQLQILTEIMKRDHKIFYLLIR